MDKKQTLEHYSKLAVEAAEASNREVTIALARLSKVAAQLEVSADGVDTMEVGRYAWMAYMDCSCGKEITAFGIGRASAIQNLAGALYGHVASQS